MLVWACIYQLTVGTVCYSLVGEMSTRRLQIKTVALGRAAYIVVAIVCNVLTPYMLNPTAGNWKGKTGFFWGGCALAFFIWTFFRLPETKGRTFEELDILFASGVPAREFMRYHVDAYAHGEDSLSKAG